MVSSPSAWNGSTWRSIPRLFNALNEGSESDVGEDEPHDADLAYAQQVDQALNRQDGSRGAPAAAADRTPRFGTWAKSLRAKGATTSLDSVSMTERLALAATRIIKQQIEITTELTIPCQSERAHLLNLFQLTQDELWAWIAARMDVTENILRGYKSQPVSTDSPWQNVDACGDLFFLSLLDDFSSVDLVSTPVVDVESCKIEAIILDGLLHALPKLQKMLASEDSAEETLTSPFFARTHSVGNATDVPSFGVPVDQDLPLASNPMLLRQSNSIRFGGRAPGDPANQAETPPSRRMSTENRLVLDVDNPLSRQGSLLHKGFQASMDLNQGERLQSTFSKRWAQSIELFVSEYTRFYENEPDGFFRTVMSLMSIEAKQSTFVELVKKHAKIRSMSSQSLRVTRSTIIHTSAAALKALVPSQFPCRPQSIRFSGEAGGGPGVDRGWWSAVCTALMCSDDAPPSATPRASSAPSAPAVGADMSAPVGAPAFGAAIAAAPGLGMNLPAFGAPSAPAFGAPSAPAFGAPTLALPGTPSASLLEPRLLHEPGHKGFFSPIYISEDKWTADLQEKYVFIGRFVALALAQTPCHIIPLRFNRHVVKYLLRRALSWHDLAFCNVDIYERFSKMMSNPEVWCEAAGQMMELERGDWHGNDCVELVSGGADIPVTGENVADYIEKSAVLLMQTGVQKQLDAMRQGLEDVFQEGTLKFLTAEVCRIIACVARLGDCVRSHTCFLFLLAVLFRILLLF